MVKVDISSAPRAKGGDMVAETLAAPASAAGTAAAQALGTDAWTSMRERVAEVFGRGIRERTEAALSRLDESALTLTDHGRPTDVARAGALLAASLTCQFEVLLDSVSDADREVVIGLLRVLLAMRDDSGVTSEAAGIEVHGNIETHSEGSSVAVSIVQGGLHMERPPQPGIEQIGR
ncbi:hypothetical protein [Streptomyces sp. NPDC001401]|uniref:hypothetical protein n=1 Tax=Streptomyces sp. NPDC001401 TaxID=3364570 RepID=UPI00369B1BD9